MDAPSLETTEPLVDQLHREEYAKLIQNCENSIEEGSALSFHYWYLGIAYLMQGHEEEAQLTWFLGVQNMDENETEPEASPVESLLREAIFFRSVEQLEKAWLLLQHARSIEPENINLHLQSISLSLQQGKFSSSIFEELGTTQILKRLPPQEIHEVQLANLIDKLSENRIADDLLIDFFEAASKHISHPESLVDFLLPMAVLTAHRNLQQIHGMHLAELCQRLALTGSENELKVLTELAQIQQNAREYDKGIQSAQRVRELAKSPAEKINANHLLLRGLMGAGGYWTESIEAIEKHKQLLNEVVCSCNQEVLDERTNMRFSSTPFFLAYAADSPVETRNFHNKCFSTFQNNIAKSPAFRNTISSWNDTEVLKSRAADPKRRLRIGYVSYNFRRHSVGWLARWLLQHHDKEKFEISLYSINHNPEHDTICSQFIENAEKFYSFDTNAVEIARSIREDEIDILIDLDSITLDITCLVMALKPAPIQATWLGLDASGSPSIDYFIADSFVLPEGAEDYYRENIVRLPSTYIAVDGFEVGVPTIRRQDLNLPEDSIVYLTAQRGYKRHPETIRLQLKILKQVPNSYLLIKGLADESSIRQAFSQLAEEEGIAPERLRFLPQDPSELIHRANLKIADVILDTFPYNGATTTLEALWMEVPVVTLVGQQFAARNSYTMLVNAGVEEGVAWSPDEYVEWGIRLGLEKETRNEISRKLRQGKHSAPLWNTKKFASEMEDAYQTMWKSYLQN